MKHSLALAGTFVFVMAGCTAKDQSSAAKTDSAATTPVAAASTPAPPTVLTVHARDFSYDALAQVPAGLTTIKLVNDGATIHHLDLIRLDSGKTIKDLEKALSLPAALPAWAEFRGGPNGVDPAGSTTATVDLTPGNYAMICFVDVPGGVPHFAKGMIRPLTVTATAPGTPAGVTPTPDVTITLSDFAFDLSRPLTAGNRTFEVKNSATQPHEVELVRLAPGKTLKQLMAWLQKPVGPPPGSAIGGMAPFVGSPTYFNADITPGNYALICFIPDAKDGRPHFMHGMMKTITVS
jgi:hypothetical protein